MLVLSRGRNDKVVFPHLGITVEILAIQGNKVRLGVDAPPEVVVLRHELLDSVRARPSEEPPVKLSHELRNRLNAATLALHLSQKQLHAGMHDEAESTLEKALTEFGSLERHLQRQPPVRPPSPPLRRAAGRGQRQRKRTARRLPAAQRLRGRNRLRRLRCARQLAASEPPDAVLLDMRMPRCDGPSTVSAIRRNPLWNGLKVFAVSGTDPETFGIATGPAGVDRWFPKPINPELLVRELSRELSVSI